jgi:hypothetical protein
MMAFGPARAGQAAWPGSELVKIEPFYPGRMFPSDPERL